MTSIKTSFLRIKGTEVPLPSDIGVEWYATTDISRNAASKAFGQWIANKWKITLSWQYLPGKDLADLVSLIKPTSSNSLFFNIQFYNPGTVSTVSINVYPGSMSQNLYKGFTQPYGVNANQVWKDIKVDLIEQ